jgi:hypothetical protein
MSPNIDCGEVGGVITKKGEIWKQILFGISQ